MSGKPNNLTDEQYLQLLKAAKLKLIKQPYRQYVPNERLEKFINAFGSDEYFITYLTAANGIGKTFGVVNMLANLMWPCNNPWFQGKLFKEWPYPKYIRIVSTPTAITDTIVPTMKAVFPEGLFNMDRYEMTKKGKQYESHFTTDTGWSGDLMTYEQDLPEFESKTIGLFWPDEPCPEAIYNACVFRLRMGGKVIMTATPLEGSAWLYDKFLTTEDAVRL